MKIGRIAELTGITRDAIRLYERMGLLKNVTRPFDFNNYKDYSEENVGRIKMILSMKKIGLSLRECKELLDKLDEGTLDAEFHKEFVNKKLEEIDKKIEELLALKETFNAMLEMGCSQEDVEFSKNPSQSVKEETMV